MFSHSILAFKFIEFKKNFKKKKKIHFIYYEKNFFLLNTLKNNRRDRIF